MENNNNTVDDKFSKVKKSFGNGKFKVELYKEKSKLNREIDDIQEKKAKIFLEMGILTYQKIREDSIDDESFDKLCDELLELDKIIYEKNMEINEIETAESNVICECGYVGGINDKYCAECGKKFELDNEYDDFIVCGYCESEIDSESEFCPCCGRKIIMDLE
ncbi:MULTISPECIES: zinc ribbon domain-containing protein [unclassified Clostridioides]|uniref:zinc ribbon domain-containing protein n=1 Tax=unclassified Clostridioides TaxID=2635829 RepID=UPI001D107711|nr:zinc ribbon domain-containing protein [Clostridioides sp. ES-S-0171-01]MCC0687889.1 zinc ribbon domain-containing protein [Clostridioides sp. ES-S-0056-01]MCC0714629.1 zinc ribbon domain-containing protein [Clostridioides sp. ES-S-0077-01]UDN53378.1 zinc ribbon domain-containing protein [Clostridioides sp. ES-S-0054-01]